MLGNSELLREILAGPVLDLILKINGENGDEVLEELKKFNKRQPCWTEPETGKCLRDAGFVQISPRDVVRFVAREHFVVNQTPGLTRITNIGPNFENWFLSGKGYQEDHPIHREVRIQKVRKRVGSEFVIEELGGDIKASVSLYTVYVLLRNAHLKRNSVNFFYVRDQGGVLAGVFLRWVRDGWHIDAISQGNEWGDNSYVYSYKDW